MDMKHFGKNILNRNLLCGQYMKESKMLNELK